MNVGRKTIETEVSPLPRQHCAGQVRDELFAECHRVKGRVKQLDQQLQEIQDFAEVFARASLTLFSLHPLTSTLELISLPPLAAARHPGGLAIHRRGVHAGRAPPRREEADRCCSPQDHHADSSPHLWLQGHSRTSGYERPRGYEWARGHGWPQSARR